MQFWAPQIKKDAERLEKVKENYDGDQRAEEASLRKTEGVLSLLPGEETAHGYHITVFQYLKDGYKENGNFLCK